MSTKPSRKIEPNRVKQKGQILGIRFGGWSLKTNKTTYESLKRRIKKGYKHQ